MNLTGYTLEIAAHFFGLRHKGYRVYMLQGEDDSTGVKLAEDYALSYILHKRPELAGCRIVSAEDYFGMQIFRGREAADDGAR